MENGMWPAYENPFSTLDGTDGQRFSAAEAARNGIASEEDGLLASAKVEEMLPSTLQCNPFAGTRWQSSGSLPSSGDLNVDSTCNGIQNDRNEFLDNDYRQNCQSCPISSDLDRRYSLLDSHSSQQDSIPVDFSRMKSHERGYQSATRNQDNFTQSLPDVSQFLSSNCIMSDSSSFACVNVNVVNSVETNQRMEQLPFVSCQNFATSPSSSAPTTNSCCEWIRSTTKQEKLILFSLFLVDFTSQMCLSIMAPFFPQEADAKGVSNSVSGWIFGVFALTQFLSSPLFGKLIPVLGSRFLIASGQFFSSGCIILFGVLDYIEPDQGNVFVSLCFVLRIALAIGCTAASTASFAVTAICFPNSISTIFGLLETATGMGMMLGPALGGFLNEIGGYMLSFSVLGGIMLLTVPLNMFCLPANDLLPTRTGTVSLRKMLRIPAVIIVNLGVIMAAIVWSILDPTLSVFLNTEFQLNSIMMGLLFLLMSCMYAASAPLWGRLADSMNDSLPLMVGGFAVSGVGLMLLGPAPFFKIEESELWLIILSLIVLGASVSLALVPTFDKILEVTERAGFKDDLTVYGFVAGLWGASFALGDFVGPAVGGWLLDAQGFGWTMSYTAFACGAMAVVILGLILYERKFQKRENEASACADSDLPSDETSDAGTNASETTPLLRTANNCTVVASFTSNTHIPDMPV